MLPKVPLATAHLQTSTSLIPDRSFRSWWFASTHIDSGCCIQFRKTKGGQSKLAASWCRGYKATTQALRRDYLKPDSICQIFLCFQSIRRDP
jgi:hypothetical protein